MIRILILLVNAYLFYLGGMYKSFWRDWLIPANLGLYFGLYFHNIWLGILVFGSYQILRLGYGNYDPENDDKPSFLGGLTKDRNGWIIKGVWGFLVSLISALPLFIFQPGLWYIHYILTCTIFAYLLCFRKKGIWIVDPVLGAVFSYIVYLVK